MNKDLIEDKLCQIIDQFNEKKITPVKFYSILLNKIHPFYDGNGITRKTLFANDKINNLIDGAKIKKLIIFIVLKVQCLQRIVILQ